MYFDTKYTRTQCRHRGGGGRRRFDKDEEKKHEASKDTHSWKKYKYKIQI